MSAPPRRSGILFIALAFALAFACSLPPAACAEERSGRAAPDPNDPVVAPRKPLIAIPTKPRITAAVKLRSKPATSEAKREYFVDGGLDAPGAGLSSRELAKLEAARVAVAAARTQGGISAPSVPSLDPAAPLYAPPTDKLERLRQAKPGAVPADPALSGLPAVPVSRQKQGPKAPTARELEKLKAAKGSPITPETNKESER